MHSILFNHYLLHFLIFLIRGDSLAIGLLPYSESTVKSSCKNMIPRLGNSQGLDFKQRFFKVLNQLMRIAIPKFYVRILSCGCYVMGILDKSYISDGQLMGENRFDAMAKV